MPIRFPNQSSQMRIPEVGPYRGNATMALPRHPLEELLSDIEVAMSKNSKEMYYLEDKAGALIYSLSIARDLTAIPTLKRIVSDFDQSRRLWIPAIFALRVVQNPDSFGPYLVGLLTSENTQKELKEGRQGIYWEYITYMADMLADSNYQPAIRPLKKVLKEMTRQPVAYFNLPYVDGVRKAIIKLES